jgi:hypothetical protein
VVIGYDQHVLAEILLGGDIAREHHRHPVPGGDDERASGGVSPIHVLLSLYPQPGVGGEAPALEAI